MFKCEKPEWNPRKPAETHTNDKAAIRNEIFSGEELVSEDILVVEHSKALERTATEGPTQNGLSMQESTPKMDTNSKERRLTKNNKDPISPRFNGHPMVRKWLRQTP
jgi:hypothetical protein